MIFMRTLFRNFILFALGGIMYIIVELLWRGYTHFSMFILGGLCFVLISAFCDAEHKPPMLYRMATGALIITSLEFVSGCLLNIKLGLNVWDYSDLPMNIYGQVCLPYAVLWFFLSGVCAVVSDWMCENLFAAASDN